MLLIVAQTESLDCTFFTNHGKQFAVATATSLPLLKVNHTHANAAVDSYNQPMRCDSSCAAKLIGRST